jgi:CRISPR/Cas system-associated protein Cas7 (RAMP superfamily)
MFSAILAKIGDRMLLLLGQALWHWLEKYAKDKKRKTEQLEAKKDYDAVLAKPQATPEERAKAYERYINSGRL